jgi:hypothetical protein
VDRKSGRGIRLRRERNNARSDACCPLPVPDISHALIAPSMACSLYLRSFRHSSSILLKPHHLRSLILKVFVPEKNPLNMFHIQTAVPI